VSSQKVNENKPWGCVPSVTIEQTAGAADTGYTREGTMAAEDT